jgi:hypothetical protein
VTEQLQVQLQFRPTTWADVSTGQTVYIDNYAGSRFPQANPRISGPYIVVSPAARTLALPTAPRNPQFMHYPDNLLTPTHPSS